MGDLVTRFRQLCQKIKVEELKERLGVLQKETTEPNFWADSQKAGRVMKEISDLKGQVDQMEILKLYCEEGNWEELEKGLKEMEFLIYLSGPYDQGEALFSIHAGQGGTEAMDWALMLKRMYLRYFAAKSWSVQEVDETVGDEAGIKSTVLEVQGPYAYGFLKGEAGVHRLVRQSPFNANNLRQTSFALVEVIPLVSDEVKVEIKDSDLEFEAFRSGGKGGQNVNKVSTAVRLRHKPSGLTVTSQAERYQAKNREIAKRILKAKLLQLELDKLQAQKSKMKGAYAVPGWGNQIRSYVLHPYKMVKDLRTGVEVASPEAVLNGDLQAFIDAELKRPRPESQGI